MHKQPRFLSIFAGLILVLVGFLFGLSVATIGHVAVRDNRAGISSSQAQAASIMIDTGRDILGFQKLTVQPNDTVFSLLTRLDAGQESLSVTSQEYKDLGVMITAINGFKNGESGKYWQYWVNNEYAQVAADKHTIRGGDVIMWKFTGSQFKEY